MSSEGEPFRRMLRLRPDGLPGPSRPAELMPMTEEVERMIIEGGSVEEIHRLAVSQGMVALRQAGLRKAIDGETTLEEVLRVVA